MTDCVECFTINAIQSSVLLLSCRSFHFVWTSLCGFLYWKLPCSAKLISGAWNVFSVTSRAVQVIWNKKGLLRFFPSSDDVPVLKNRAAVLATLQASSDVCQRLHSLAEVCGSPGLTRGWGDVCLCTWNTATVRNWTMWKALFRLWSLFSPPFLS